MENGTEWLIPFCRALIREVSPEIEDIFKRVETLPSEEKTQLVRKLIETLTTNELAVVLDEISSRLRRGEGW